jgi:hypothetical protein
MLCVHGGWVGGTVIAHNILLDVPQPFTWIVHVKGGGGGAECEVASVVMREGGHTCCVLCSAHGQYHRMGAGSETPLCTRVQEGWGAAVCALFSSVSCVTVQQSLQRTCSLCGCECHGCRHMFRVVLLYSPLC